MLALQQWLICTRLYGCPYEGTASNQGHCGTRTWAVRRAAARVNKDSLWQSGCTDKGEVERGLIEAALRIEMKKIKSSGSKARFWMILIAINVLAIGYVLGLCLRTVTSDEQLFAAMALIFVAFLMVIADIVSIALACEVWLDQRH
jgi:hypothetical protein